MATHRYWRILVGRNFGGGSFSTGITEIEMRETAGGADVTSSAFAIGSQQQATSGNLSFAAAFDNVISNGSFWQTPEGNNGNGTWIGQDFGAGNEKDITEVVITSHPTNPERTPFLFFIQYSDDKSVWTTAWTCYFAWAVTLQTLTFTKPAVSTTGRHWMIRATTIPSVTYSAAEIEMRATIGGADQTGSGTAYQMTTFSASTAAAKAFDNNTSTVSSGDSGIAGTEFVAYDFGAGHSVAVNQIAWTARSDGFAGQNPTAAEVLYSPDGLSFLTAWTYTTDTWVAGATQILSNLAAPALTVRRRSILFT